MKVIYSAWADVRKKAKRIFDSNGVRVVAVTPKRVKDPKRVREIEARVKGDHGTYKCKITFTRGTKRIAAWSCSCFPPGTLVFMANGERKPIEEVNEGEYVLTHNGRAKKVRKTMAREYEGDLISIETNSSPIAIKATPEHPFLWANEDWGQSFLKQPFTPKRAGLIARKKPLDIKSIKWEKAENIQEGDYLSICSPHEEREIEFEYDNKIMTKITKISKEPYKGKVYNLDVEDDDSYLVGNGIAVHNCKWYQYVWDRSPHYKRLEGRICSHVLALHMFSQSLKLRDALQKLNRR